MRRRSGLLPRPVITRRMTAIGTLLPIGHVRFDGRYQGESGPDMLASSSSQFDPTVWSGRAVQEVSSILAMRSCITVSGLSLERLLRAIMGISAHAT